MGSVPWAYNVLVDSCKKAKRAVITAFRQRTFMYSSVASCHSLVMVRGRMGLANMRVNANTAKEAQMTPADRKKTLRPSSGGGGRRGPWGPKAM
jgi:hypothetical protein